MTADSCQLKAKAFLLVVAVFLIIPKVEAQTHFIDLSKAANRGLAESFDEAFSGIKDIQEKNGLKDLPTGPQTFRGIPFQILDPAKNQGRSFVVLKSRRRPDFPDGVSIQTGNLKASTLYFLHTCRWGGTAQNITVAEYDIVYDDGQVTVIPLRVGVEFTNFFGADDTASSFLAWWHKYKNTEMGVNLFPWKNPRPDQAIQSILFKSRGNMPVPILFAITASDKELIVSSDSPKPEKTFQTDTSNWIPFEPSGASPAGTAIDISSLLDAPAGRHGKVKTDGDKLVFEDGTPARFWGLRMILQFSSLPEDFLQAMAKTLPLYGCNYVSLDLSEAQITTNLEPALEAFRKNGVYVTLWCDHGVTIPSDLMNDPIFIARDLLPTGTFHRNFFQNGSTTPVEFNDQPMVMNPESSFPYYFCCRRGFGMPLRVDWLNGWPNEYQAEAPLLLAAYGCFQDWTACVGMGIPWGKNAEKMLENKVLFDEPQSPIQWPVAALAYLRGDLKEGKTYVFQPKENAPDKITALKILAHRSGTSLEGAVKTDRAGELKAKVNEKTDSFVSDTGQITWQGNVGIVKVDSPRFQALIGFLGHRKFNNAYWAVETPNPFVSLSVISLNKGSISLSDHLLVTGVTRMENTGQIYNATKTKLLNPGKAPILVEPLSAKFVLYRPKADPKLKIRGLDANGQPLKSKVPAKWVKNSFVFSWVSSAFYLEIYK